MPRVAKVTDPLRISRLKKQVDEPDYMEYAVARIAIALSDQIVRREVPPPTLSAIDKTPGRHTGDD